MRRFLILLITNYLLLITPLAAQQLILDEEFSQACQTLTNPLRGSLAPNTSVHFVLVNSPEINAFVTGENIVFVHSGLVLKAKSAAELQGVLAHELGHITAHHLFQGETNARNATIGAVAGAVVGMGAAIAGAPQVGSAIMMGSQAGAITGLLAHTRMQEQEADRYAVNALHNAGYSAQGMVGMFTTLRTESQLSYDSPPAWLVTHPLPPQRLATLQGIVAAEKTGLIRQPTGVDFARLQTKVGALASTPASVLRGFTGKDDLAAYARTIAYINLGKLQDASTLLTPLLAAHPDDPYYQELAATLATQQGKLASAETILAKIIAAHPTFQLIRFEYAEILRAQNKPALALAQYTRITTAWPEWSEAWYGQGITYGQLGRLAESHLSLTEASLAAADPISAKQSLELAKHYLKEKPNADLQVWADALSHRLENTSSQ
ncbi:MAG: M48 family metalloprotease [Proteobacteria bacterium]|nr:M48 family metalloprotease [Pseudomonadota bacterium]